MKQFAFCSTDILKFTHLVMNESVTTVFSNFTSPSFGVLATDKPGNQMNNERNDGPLTPVHYIIFVLIIYMGGIAVFVMKSVQVSLTSYRDV